MKVNIPLEDHSRIVDFLPDHDFSAFYEIRVKAPASVVYERLLSLDFSKLWLVRILMMVRSGKRLPRDVVSGDLRQRLQGTGFVILAEVPNEELVIGVAGRFWPGDAWNSPRMALPGLFAQASRRLRGISGCAQSRPGVRSFQPRQESAKGEAELQAKG